MLFSSMSFCYYYQGLYARLSNWRKNKGELQHFSSFRYLSQLPERVEKNQ